MNNRKCEYSEEHVHFTRICFPATVYMLLQYLLLSSVAEIQETFFFFHDTISESIREKFNNRYEIRHFSSSRWKKACLIVYYVYLKWTKYRRWPFLAQTEYFIGDHLYLGWILGADHDYSLLEDGLANYITSTPTYRFSKWRYWFLCILFWPFPFKSWGRSSHCKCLFLTRDLPENSPFRDTPRSISSFEDLWKKADFQKKELIKSVFEINSGVFAQLQHNSSCTLLLTQPLSEGGICSEQEKISCYRKIICLHNLTNVVIKAHPLERTDYQKYFPGAMILPSSVPMELLILSGISFKQVVTICSTAVLLFQGKCPIIWIGTEFSERLHQQWGYIPRPSSL